MESIPETSRRHCDGIMHHLRDYLEIREQQAIRINPALAGVIGDMVWVQLENTRKVMLKPKSFGPERIRVCDLLAGFDDAKRRALFHHADQNSILYEVMDKQEDQGRKRVSEMAIHDMKTLFHALNPGLESLIELLQHWSIWDLPDASDLYNFTVQLRRVEHVRTQQLPEDMLDRYREVLQKSPADTVAQPEVLQLEFHRLEGILHRFQFRRSEEEPYQIIIRRDEKPGSEANAQIELVARHIRALAHLEGDDEAPLDESLIAHYAQALHCEPPQVTRLRAADYERRVVASAKQALRSTLINDTAQGEPYDYKRQQLRTMEQQHAEERLRLESAATVQQPVSAT